MDRAIMWIMAAGALIGGADRIFGNRLGLGKKFEEGFLLMGSTALSMAGIICLVPLLSKLLRALGALLLAIISPALSQLGIDTNWTDLFTGIIIVAAIIVSALKNLEKPGTGKR